MFRLYGPLEPTFDGTWKLNNIGVDELMRLSASGTKQTCSMR
jgi:hypothetical protein